MRIVFLAIVSIWLGACVDTTLDTPGNHPANPSAFPAAPSKAPPALASGFDPFVAYEGAKQSDATAVGLAPSEQPVPTDATLYTCTMHPEIIRNAPGNCPICGMKLVPKKPSDKSTP